jgi:hypothetical protein
MDFNIPAFRHCLLSVAQQLSFTSRCLAMDVLSVTLFNKLLKNKGIIRRRIRTVVRIVLLCTLCIQLYKCLDPISTYIVNYTPYSIML